MHDLVNDLAKSVSGQYFVWLEDHQQYNDSLIAMRHLSYLSSYNDVFQKFKPLHDSKYLRTFLPLDFRGDRFPRMSQILLVDVLPTFRSLRVLSLLSYKIKELPNSFSNLKQLRFLNLSRTSIEKLPSWICTFYNLQTLLLAGCTSLKVFPKNMEKLINLRNLDISGVQLTKMPMKIERLEKLQFLSMGSLMFGKDSNLRIEELGRLFNLH